MSDAPKRRRRKNRDSANRATRVGRRLRGLARTTAALLVLGVLFVVASVTAVAVSKDPAPLVISFGALALSAGQFWRTELRGPNIKVLVMDSASVDIETPSTHGQEHYVVTVRQPVVVENVGGQPCVLAKFRIDGDLVKVSGWGEEHLEIEDGLGGPWDRPRPLVLVPREPVLFTARWWLQAMERPVDGKPLNLRDRVTKSGIGLPTRSADLAFSEAGTTIRKYVPVSMNVDAVRNAVEQLVIVSEGGEASARILSPDPINLDFQDVPRPPTGRGLRRLILAATRSGLAGHRTPPAPSQRGNDGVATVSTIW